MKIDKEYDKYIRFYLDSLLDRPVLKKDFQIYPTGPNKKYVTYMQKLTGNEDYLLTYPISAIWNLTSACNFRCVHCLYNDTEYLSDNDLSPQQAMKLSDELINDFGIVYVLLTGGEIFLRKDLMDLIRKFKSNNVAIKLLTNASLITDEQIDELSELFNPYTDSMQISLDGATNETFKKIRRTDSFGKITENIRKLCDKKINVTVVCTVNTINYNEVIDTYKLSDQLGVYGFLASILEYHNESHSKLMVPTRDLFKLYYELAKCETSKTPGLSINFFSPIDILNIPEVRTIIEEERYQNLIKTQFSEAKPWACQHHDKIAIQSDGTLYLCMEALTSNLAPLGNYKKNSLLEIWENRYENMLFQPRKIENMACNKCSYNKFCNSGCMVKAYMRTKNLNTPSIKCGHYCQ